MKMKNLKNEKKWKMERRRTTACGRSEAGTALFPFLRPLAVLREGGGATGSFSLTSLMLLTASTSTGTMLALVKDGLVLLALKATDSLRWSEGASGLAELGQYSRRTTEATLRVLLRQRHRQKGQKEGGGRCHCRLNTSSSRHPLRFTFFAPGRRRRTPRPHSQLEVCGTNALDIANMHASTKMTHFIALNSLLELVSDGDLFHARSFFGPIFSISIENFPLNSFNFFFLIF